MGLRTCAKVLLLLTKSMLAQDDVTQCFLALPTNFTHVFWPIHTILSTLFTVHHAFSGLAILKDFEKAALEAGYEEFPLIVKFK